ncbi:ester cyclase [Salinibacterium sp. M195]|nr:ester cyclase [Salinibacterium sp. M195]
MCGVEATGKKIELDEISIYRIENGRIAEQWCLSDDVSTLLTLGLLQSAPDT